MDQNVNQISDSACKSGPVLAQKVGRGTVWLTSARGITVALGLIRTTVLARLLAPDDFGLMVFALTTIAVLEKFSQSGFEKALIQRRKDIREFLDTAWLIMVVRGFALFAILFFGSVLVAAFYEKPEIISILRVIAISFPLRGLTNIGVVYFKREMIFKKQFVFQLSEAIALLAVSIPLAFLLRNVWALVLGMLAGNLVQLVVSYVIHPYRPGLNFNLKKAVELFSFGKWIYAASILVLILGYGGNVLVAKVLGFAALGIYGLAYRYSSLPATEIAQVISQVTLPAYSQIQSDLRKVRDAYLRVLQTVAFISLPLAGIIFVLGTPFIKMFLGEAWLPMTGPLKILCFAGALRAIQNTSGSLFTGIGKPKVATQITAVNVVVLALAMYPLTLKFGIAGTAIAVVMSLFASNSYAAFKAHQIARISYSSLGKQLVAPVLSVLAFVVIAMIVQSASFYLINIFFFCVILILSVITYIGSVLLLDRLFDCDTVGLYSLVLKSLGFKAPSKNAEQWS